MRLKDLVHRSALKNRSAGEVDVDTDTSSGLDSPAFTGSPTAPTQPAGDNSTKLATTAYIDRGPAAYVDEPFDAALAAGWTVDQGAGTFNITGGKLVPTSSATKWIRRTDVAQVADAKAFIKFNIGALPAAALPEVDIWFRSTDTNNALLTSLFYNNATGKFFWLLTQRLLGVETSAVASVDAGLAPIANHDYWFVARWAGNWLFTEIHEAHPALGNPRVTKSWDLSSAVNAAFRDGHAGYTGFRFYAQADLSSRIDEFVAVTTPDPVTRLAF